MENCLKCKHAEWRKTKNGRLHPSGDGRCTYPYKIPELPAAKYWFSTIPSPHGGHINRREELISYCAYYIE